MELSKMGIIAQNCLNDIPNHFSEIKIIGSMVMPNHVHLLLKLTKTNGDPCRDVACNVSTNKPNVSTNKSQFFSYISPKPKSISTVIRSFKSAVTKQINPKTVFFAWQPRFYDEIIKDHQQFLITQKYIQNNVKNWQKDKFYR